MHKHPTAARSRIEILAQQYLTETERAHARRTADASPTGRATREATAGALGAALASSIRRNPARALDAHSATTYAIVGGTADVVVAPSTRRLQLRAAVKAAAADYTPDKVIAPDSHPAFRIGRGGR